MWRTQRSGMMQDWVGTGSLLTMMFAFVVSTACSLAPEKPSVDSHLSDQVQQYQDALTELRKNPHDSARQCETLAVPSMHTDCLMAGAEALAESHPDKANALCLSIPTGFNQDECMFQVAERSGDANRCAKAGRFARDCKMHLWSRALQAWVQTIPTGELEILASEEMTKFGFDMSDADPWTALFRASLSSTSPLDLSECTQFSGARQTWCRDAGISLYNDRINHVRDTRGPLCSGDSLPPLLQARPDPDLQQRLEERIASDLCPNPPEAP